MATPKERQAEHVHGPHCNHNHDEGEHLPRHTPYRRDTPKPRRNDPCFCGSGLKFKKCHGTAGA